MDTPKKFFPVLSHLMVDISSHQELINKSNSGTLREIANTLSKSTIIVIGFPR
jgi:hypothetical protein